MYAIRSYYAEILLLRLLLGLLRLLGLRLLGLLRLGLFGVGNIFLKLRRENLPRPERAAWISA